MHEWLDGLPKAEREVARAALDAAITLLEVQPRVEWSRSRWKPMTGDAWTGIYEIRFKTRQKRLYRILSMFGPGTDTVTMLDPEVKSSGRLPSSAAEKSRRRRQAIEEGAGVKQYP